MNTVRIGLPTGRWLPGLAMASFAVVGCGGVYDEPTIDDFNGQLTHQGQPVGFASDERVVLQLVFRKNGERFGVPVSSAGAFDIGWMPIGEFAASLERTPLSPNGTRAGRTRMYSIPNGLAIAEGQTDYTIDLGEKFKL